MATFEVCLSNADQNENQVATQDRYYDKRVPTTLLLHEDRELLPRIVH